MRAWGAGRTAFWITAAAVVALDQLVKHQIEQSLRLDADVIPLPLGASIRHIHNPGVAFGQLPNAGPMLILAAFLASAGMIAYRLRIRDDVSLPHVLLNIGLALPLGGALGNSIDRIRIGKVVDFFDLGWFPVFNVADSAITLGAIALGIYFLLIHRPAPSAEPVPPQQSTVPEQAQG